MTINIDDLTASELVALNRQIVERLKFLDSVNIHHEVMQFSPGEQVSFDPPGREKQIAILVKFNRKTVTLYIRKYLFNPGVVTHFFTRALFSGRTAAAG